MCGIVGLFLKDSNLQPELGSLLSTMLITMTERGPDSAGIAIYNSVKDDKIKITIQSKNPNTDFPLINSNLSSMINTPVSIDIKDTHAVLKLPSNKIVDACKALGTLCEEVKIMSVGEKIEIFKEVGRPAKVVDRFSISKMSGTHGIGHTRMATESIVTTMGAHPFSTGNDQCLVHNGSLSNHNSLRRSLEKEGVLFETENDTEVGAAYISNKLNKGNSLKEALETSLIDLDGFFTFLVGTKDGFGVVRDPIACKPAIMAETDRYVAFGSEYRALVELPNIEDAKVWEPEPATVYFWSH
jgi:amidophosphoribosyltransferase|tara:strand:+ start:185 stop:1081 length:897 start_codon:yes stop_codon:yes gene_type:complete